MLPFHRVMRQLAPDFKLVVGFWSLTRHLQYFYDLRFAVVLASAAAALFPLISRRIVHSRTAY